MKYSAVMLGTSFGERGGISSVVEMYGRYGFFERWSVRYISTHIDGYKLKKIFVFIFAIIDFVFILMTNKIQVVHVHTASRYSFLRKSIFLSICRIFNIPYIIHLHGARFMSFYNYECPKFIKRIIYSVFMSSSSVIVLSEAWRRMVCDVFCGVNAKILHNPARFSNILPASRSGFNILFSGRMGQRKGIFDLLNAFVYVVKAVPNVHLTCCGDGQISECRQQVDALGLASHVDVLGWVGQERLQRILAETDIFVLPSYDEGLPMSLLEAMAANIAVVSTPVGGIPDLIQNGENGFLVPPGTVDALADLLIFLLTNPARRLAVAEKGRATIAQDYSIESVLVALGEIYRGFGLDVKPSSVG